MFENDSGRVKVRGSTDSIYSVSEEKDPQILYILLCIHYVCVMLLKYHLFALVYNYHYYQLEMTPERPTVHDESRELYLIEQISIVLHETQYHGSKPLVETSV